MDSVYIFWIGSSRTLYIIRRSIIVWAKVEKWGKIVVSKGLKTVEINEEANAMSIIEMHAHRG